MLRSCGIIVRKSVRILWKLMAYLRVRKNPPLHTIQRHINERTFITHTHIHARDIAVGSILILLINLNLSVPKCSFSSSFTTVSVYVFQFSPIHATLPAHNSSSFDRYLTNYAARCFVTLCHQICYSVYLFFS